GTKIGSELYINETVLNTQRNPDIGMNSVGDFVIVWGDGPQGVMSRRYDSAGTPLTGETFLADGYSPLLAMDSIGKYVVVWGSEDGIFGQRFLADGTAYGTQFLAAAAGEVASNQALSINDLGEFVIAWDDLSHDDIIKVRRLSFDLEAEFSWNLYADDPGGEWCWVLELFEESEGIAAECEWEVSGPGGFYRTGSFQDPKFDLFEAGEYTVVLHADGLGISDSIAHTITVSAPIPEPSTIFLMIGSASSLAVFAGVMRRRLR
ncbi:MAG: PEP-CTERM sorting domain-containing protein, partial [Planctomycetota bacterium]